MFHILHLWWGWWKRTHVIYELHIRRDEGFYFGPILSWLIHWKAYIYWYYLKEWMPQSPPTSFIWLHDSGKIKLVHPSSYKQSRSWVTTHRGQTDEYLICFPPFWPTLEHLILIGWWIKAECPLWKTSSACYFHLYRLWELRCWMIVNLKASLPQPRKWQPAGFEP